LLDFWATLVCTATEQNNRFVDNKQLSLNFVYLYYEFLNICASETYSCCLVACFITETTFHFVPLGCFYWKWRQD